MPIPIDCPDCFRSYQVPEKFEGKTIRCKSCGAAIPVEKAYRDTIDDDDAFGPQWSDGQSSRAKTRRAAKGPSHRLPFWIPVAICAGVLLLMMLVGLFSPIAALILAVLAIGIGCLALFVGKIVLMVESSREDSTQALLVFFVPFYSLFYQISRWPRTRTSVQVMTIGLLGVAFAPLILFAAVFAAGGNDPFDNLGKNRVAQNGNQPGGNQRAFPGPAGRQPLGPPGWPGRAGPPRNPAERFPNFSPPNRPDPRDNFRPPQPGFPFSPRPANNEKDDSEPKTVTWYLTRYNSSFDPDEDHLAKLENYLASQREYVPGSAKLDLQAGTFSLSFKGSPIRSMYPRVRLALMRIGLRAEKERPAEPWVGPDATKTLSYGIVEIMKWRREHIEGQLGDAADEALSRYGGGSGYVAGSVKIDEQNQRITLKSRAPFMSESTIWIALASVGFKVEKSSTTPK